MQRRQNHVKKRAEREQFNKKKEKYFGNEQNKFTQVDSLTFQEAKLRLQQKTKSYNIQINNVNFGNPQGLKHFVAKSVLAYTLINKEQHCSTEVLDCDCYWIERDFGIEIEKDLTQQKYYEKYKKFSKIFTDILIFNLNEIPDDLIPMQKYFIKKLGV